jgi:hypothetical protein
MVFGEMNAGTVACAHIPAKIRTLPHNAHTRTAAYVDDNAQGSHTSLRNFFKAAIPLRIGN